MDVFILHWKSSDFHDVTLFHDSLAVLADLESLGAGIDALSEGVVDRRNGVAGLCYFIDSGRYCSLCSLTKSAHLIGSAYSPCSVCIVDGERCLGGIAGILAVLEDNPAEYVVAVVPRDGRTFDLHIGRS